LFEIHNCNVGKRVKQKLITPTTLSKYEVTKDYVTRYIKTELKKDDILVKDITPSFIDNLFVLQGSFINMEYPINGNNIKLLDDNANYWGNQVEKQGTTGRCFGIACNEHYILVSEYGKDGADAELVVLKKREG
jgi:hypothetical protein